MLCTWGLMAGILGLASGALSPAAIAGTLRGAGSGAAPDFRDVTAGYGFKAVSYEVVTDDGYILNVFRLKGDERRPVLLLHGLFDTSDGWVIRGNASLGLMLARAGYDVWLLNVRGNRYSRAHRRLSPDTDPAFWDFSLHEMGLHDVPAAIDHVLRVTGQRALSIVGFSQGTTITLVAGSLRPEYNEKIKVFVALAPVAYLHNSGNLLRIIIYLGPVLNVLIPWFINEISGYYSISKAIINLVCTQLDIGYDLCYGGAVSPLIGPDMQAIDSEFFNTMVQHFPAGTSKKHLIHFSQVGISGTFGAYNHGPTRNLREYNSSSPPTYDLSKVEIDTYLFSGKNDWVSTLADVEILAESLPRLRRWAKVADARYNHLDMMWARDVDAQVNAPVIQILDEYNKV